MPGVKIALCITDLDVGGAEQALVALATRVDRSCFTPTVYCLGAKPLRSSASAIPPLEAAHVEFHCLDARGAIAFPRVLGQLQRHFLRQRPELVQTFLFHANFVGRIAARRAGVPSVVCGIRVAERSSRWHLWLDRLTSRWVDRYVCVSQAVARFSTVEGGLPPEKITVIPNGVDVESYPASNPVPPAGLGLPSGRRLVTFVGRLEPQKGVRWLVQSAPEWLARAPECDLLIVGHGPERGPLERLARQLGIAHRVHWVGWRSDVPQILAASDLLVLPSRWEGMPNVLLQAMASRLPVLASDVEGVRELLGPDAEPQVVRFGDTPSWTHKLVQLLCDRTLAAELGARNRVRTELQFRIERVVAAYQDLWASLIARHNGARKKTFS